IVLSNFQPQVDEKALVTRLQVPESLKVRADYEGIRRVLLNLISNAVKFSGKGGEFGVAVRAPEGASDVEVEVWDRGPGIPEEAQRHLFTRFWQADGSSRRRHGGTGLGLAIVKGILDAHGSAAKVTSAPDSGTSIRFPLRRAPARLPLEESPHDVGAPVHPDR